MHILILPLTLCWQQVGLEQKLLFRKGASVEGTTPTGRIESFVLYLATLASC